MPRPIGSFRRDRRGATALEFGMVALPFFTLMFTILGCGIHMFVYGAMDAATKHAARQVRIGAIRGSTSAAIRDLVCAKMAGLAACSAIQVYVTSGASYTALTPATVAAGTLSLSTYSPGIANSYVLLQVAYTASVLLPLPNTLAPTFITSVAFRNEP